VHDDTTEKLIEMLHLLKSTPSPVFHDSEELSKRSFHHRAAGGGGGKGGGVGGSRKSREEDGRLSGGGEHSHSVAAAGECVLL